MNNTLQINEIAGDSLALMISHIIILMGECNTILTAYTMHYKALRKVQYNLYSENTQGKLIKWSLTAGGLSDQWSLKASGLIIQMVSNTGLTVLHSPIDLLFTIIMNPLPHMPIFGLYQFSSK